MCFFRLGSFQSRLTRAPLGSDPLAAPHSHRQQGLGGRGHLRYSSAQCHLSSWGLPKANQGGPKPGASHLLFRWKPPTRVLEPLEVLELDPDVFYVELEQVPETRQVLSGGLGVRRRVLECPTKEFDYHELNVRLILDILF